MFVAICEIQNSVITHTDHIKLHNKKTHYLPSSPKRIPVAKSKRMRCAGHLARTGEKRNADRVLVGKPEGQKSLRRPRRKLDNIKTGLTEIGLEGVHCINLSQGMDWWQALVNTVKHLRVP